MPSLFKSVTSRVLPVLVVWALLPMVPGHAGDDPNIKGKLRSDIQLAMQGFVDGTSVDRVMRVYDPIEGRVLRLRFDKFHDGIVQKGDFYVSCADFTDQDSRKIDVDFLVVPSGDSLIATQAIVHSVDGKKRKYHLED